MSSLEVRLDDDFRLFEYFRSLEEREKEDEEEDEEWDEE